MNTHESELARALSYAERLAWFHEARFGMFIHWGLYSLLGRGEWVQFNERIRPADYAKLARRFTARKFDARAWAGLAAEAGMKYAVLTARHHDGFCLFDSQVSDFTSVKTAARRDFVAEYVAALREAGLRVGIYYSLLDWRFPGYFEPERHPDSAAALVSQAHAQVRELMTNYGKIDVLWYDGDWVAHGMKKVDIAAFWRARELNAMVRGLQPQILINNRCGVPEDLDTPEQHVTASAAGRGWESCMTIGDASGWGYTRHNPNMKSRPQLVQNLVSAAVGEGNLLLNVGPRPDGTIRPEEVGRLKAIGRWMRANGESIYGSQRLVFHNQFTQAAWHLGPWTRKGTTGYLHVFRWPGSEAVIPCVATPVRRASLLATGAAVTVRQDPYCGRLILSGLPVRPPDAADTVIKVEFETEPQSVQEPDLAAWLKAWTPV
jgi:alpha-L-fucosidase